MSENPYASYPSYQDDPVDAFDGPSRLSIPAVLSLIAGLLCCLPGLGVLAMLLGMLGAISVSRSRGRLGGMPAAISGMALGLLSTIGWIVLAMGAGSGLSYWVTNITPPLSRIVEGAYLGDVAAVRAEMTPAGAGLITDEEIIAFGQAMRAEFGEFRGAPVTFNEWMQAAGEGFGRTGGQFGGSAQSAVPTLLFTDAGGVAVFGVFDPAGQPSQVFRYQDIFVLLPNGEALTLRDDGPARVEAIRLNFTPVTSQQLLDRALQAPEAPEAPVITPTLPDAPE
ncbi:MAG: DUF4190 domain-containing protein [Phycisphaeraceae bacterium]|nr:DUF4190 domain-containing protein [Phycisphaeraceae bacterium]